MAAIFEVPGIAGGMFGPFIGSGMDVVGAKAPSGTASDPGQDFDIGRELLNVFGPAAQNFVSGFGSALGSALASSAAGNREVDERSRYDTTAVNPQNTFLASLGGAGGAGGFGLLLIGGALAVVLAVKLLK